MILQVESCAGLHGDLEPLAFLLGGQRIDVVEIVDRWIGAEHSYFRVAASDHCMYILRYTLPLRQWELTLFQAPAG
jgi:hypothetical protein